MIARHRAVAPELAQQAHDFLLKDAVVNATFECWARQIERKYPDVLPRVRLPLP